MPALSLGQPVKQKQLLNHKEEKLICEVRTPDGKQLNFLCILLLIIMFGR